MSKIFPARFLVTLIFSVTAWGQSAPPTKSVPERLGHPASARLLVIHADDFGMSHSVNRAIEEAPRGAYRKALKKPSGWPQACSGDSTSWLLDSGMSD